MFRRQFRCGHFPSSFIARAQTDRPVVHLTELDRSVSSTTKTTQNWATTSSGTTTIPSAIAAAGTTVSTHSSGASSRGAVVAGSPRVTWTSLTRSVSATPNDTPCHNVFGSASPRSPRVPLRRRLWTDCSAKDRQRRVAIHRSRLVSRDRRQNLLSSILSSSSLAPASATPGRWQRTWEMDRTDMTRTGT